MSLTLDGYRIDRLLHGSTSVRVYLGERREDGRPIVAKLLALERRPGALARVEYEFGLLRSLDCKGVVRALALERSGERRVLVLERHFGRDLAEHVGGRVLPIPELLELARVIAEILVEVHRRGVLHRDLRPANILIDPETGELALADFGLSALLESVAVHDPQVLDRSLPYLAPEQLVRSGREIDVRSDLYSLGAILFELATGRRPFPGRSSIELIHAHLVRRPEAPQWLRPELPGAISALILKLLEKAPERRYQTASGLLDDLAAIADRLAEGEPLDEFVLGRHDQPTRLRLPHQLFGREREIDRLRERFRQAANGQSSLVVIEGPAGIGKSALLGELLEPVLARRGFLLRAELERSGRPFAAIVELLGDLAEQLSGASEAELRRWRHELLDELGGLAAPLAELVPGFAALLGHDARPSQGPMSSATEARSRVVLALQRLFARVAKPDHPLVLAIDDLDRIDRASGELLAKLLDDVGLALLIIGSSREGEREVLTELIEGQRRAGREVASIELRPLAPAALAELLAATFAGPPVELAGLAERLANASAGNPLVVRRVLLALGEREGWRREIATLDPTTLPSEGLALLAAVIDRLEPGPREAIELASVVGARFEVELLDQLAGRSLIADLYRLADAGLIAASGELWSFAHDRVRVAARRRLGTQRERALHLAIARALAERGDHDPTRRVEHLARARGLLAGIDDETAIDPDARARAIASLEPAERRELARLLGRAGLRALGLGAPHSALPMLELSRALEGDALPGRDQPDHAELVAIALGHAEALAMIGRHADADASFRALLEREAELSPDEYAALVIRRLRSHVQIGERERALAFGIAGLRRLGVALPERPGKLAAAASLMRLALNTRESRLAALREDSPARDARACAAMELLRVLAATAYVTHPELFAVLVERHVALLRRHGRHRSAPLVLVQAALLLALGLGRRADAWRLVALAKRIGQGSLDYYAMLCEQFIRHWEHSYRDCLPTLREVGELAVEAGDLECADYAEAMRIELSFHAGIHLRLLEQQVDARIRRRESWGTGDLAGGGPPLLALCRILAQGPAPGPGELDPCGAARLVSAGIDDLHVEAAKLSGAIALVSFGRPHEALVLLDQIHVALATALRGTWMVVALLTFHGLAIAGTIESTGRARRRLAELRRHAKQLRRWAETGGNCWTQVDLLEGELLALRGQPHAALQLWQRAADRAVEQRVPMYEGLACERIAMLLESEDLTSLVRSPLERARAAYRHWGAFAKVAQLEREWPVLGQRIVGASVLEDPSIDSAAQSTATTEHAVDMVSLLRTSQAIASDIRLEDVVERILTIAVENAGADRGVLLLQRGERGLSVVADCDARGERADRGRAGRWTTVLAEPIPLALAGDRVPGSLLRWIERARESVVLAEAASDPRFAGDPYVGASGVRSALGVPIVKHDQLVGMLYLENRQSADSFTNDRLEVIGLLIGQAASALENARLYEALRGSELRWRSLVERLPDVVAVVDREGRVEFINHLEDPEQFDALGNQILDLVRATQRQLAGDHLREAFEGQTAAVELETSPGRWWMVRFAPIESDGRIDRVIMVSTDITERREAEHQRASLEAQLRQQQRLESIGTLASGVAHEINNPIQGIMNYAELIGDSPGSNPEIREFADEIAHETKRVATIVRNLLAFSRQEGERSMLATGVASVVEGTLSLIHAVLRKDQILLEVALADDLPEIECRPQQIQQVIMNLVTNARDALNGRFVGHHPDKRISIDAQAFERDDRSWVRISVADQGGGVPEHAIARIFDPFFTTKGRDQGTGLGLAVSHGIIKDHRGVLRLDNRVGVGATFHVELPCRSDQNRMRRPP
ncbi:protein kinase domain-containing protein [Nannocystaceae bacterium ST9]